jgi:hypothetical protein
MKRAVQLLIGSVVLALLVTACIPPAVDATTRTGLRYGDAKDRELQLRVHMSQDEVLRLFGQPSRTDVGTCGQQSAGGPWTCLTWDYWWYAISQRLSIRFYQDRGVWYVNSWRWWNFY